MSEEQLNEMLENIENAFWYLKNCKCNIDVTTKGHKWETYYGLDDDLIKYIRKIENQLQQKENIIKGLDNTIENLEEVIEQKENIIKEVREYIEDLYDVRFTDKDKRKILEILDKGE